MSGLYEGLRRRNVIRVGIACLAAAWLLHSIGAPFDPEACPVFSAMLADSGLEWPPRQALVYPLTQC